MNEKELRRLRSIASGYRQSAQLDELARRDPAALQPAERLRRAHYLEAREAFQAIQRQEKGND